MSAQNDLRSKYVPAVEAVTGWGIGGPIRAQLARARALKLGDVEVRSVVIRLSLQRSGGFATSPYAGLVGADVLKQFNITFDYSRQRLIFERNRQYGKPDTYDRSGMWLSQSPDGKYFEVFDVVAGGPAAAAGLKVGDKILAIDGKSAERLVLPTVRLKLKSDPPKKQVRLTVQSEGGRREVVVRLRDLV